MKRSKQQERRNHAKVNAGIPLDLSIPGSKGEETLHAISVNVSLNGVYCHVNRHIPLFTRIRVMFVNPDHQTTSTQIISQCDGIVVRIEPEHEERDRNEYHVVLGFQRLFQPQREALHQMICSYPAELVNLPE